MATLALAVVAWGEDRYDLAVATTMGLTTLSLMHIAAALEVRELTGTIFDRYTIANRRFVQLIGVALVLTFLVTEVQPLQRIFDTVPLTSSQWGICLLGPDRLPRGRRARKAPRPAQGTGMRRWPRRQRRHPWHDETRADTRGSCESSRDEPAALAERDPAGPAGRTSRGSRTKS